MPPEGRNQETILSRLSRDSFPPSFCPEKYQRFRRRPCRGCIWPTLNESSARLDSDLDRTAISYTKPNSSWSLRDTRDSSKSTHCSVSHMHSQVGGRQTEDAGPRSLSWLPGLRRLQDERKGRGRWACSPGLGIGCHDSTLTRPACRGRRRRGQAGRKPWAAQGQELHKRSVVTLRLPHFCLMGVTERGDNRVVAGDLCSVWSICYFISAFLNKCPEAMAMAAVG